MTKAATELTPEQIKTLLHGITIPSQPQILVDLQLEEMSPDCSLQRIADIITLDPGLCGSLLKIVNSAAFGLNVLSVHKACALLGIQGVLNIANALSIRGALSDDDIVSLARFWDSAADVAMLAANIAQETGLAKPDEIYSVALFHNCGIPLLMKRFIHYDEILRTAYTSPHILDEENRRLNTDHAIVGYYIAKSWRLPDAVCSAIRDHHRVQPIFADPFYADTTSKNLLAILKMAEHLGGLHRILGEQEEDLEWQQIGADVLSYAGLSAADLGHLK
ncbi:MAG: HDOD domain-containing protein [Spongiibacteraceae bacterium]